MSIRCLIIDDKPLAVDLLVNYTRKIPFLELAATTTDPFEGLCILRDQKIDLVFLDIQMPGITGLQLTKIVGKQCKVILTTAYSEYALDGFEHDVIDYLLKPISFERFYRAAEKALRQIGQNDETAASTPKTIPGINDDQQSGYLFIKSEHRIRKVALGDILFIESLQNYINLHTAGANIMSLQTLKKTEALLPPKDFLRVHRSYIVALKHITLIERSRIIIGEHIIPIGDSYREILYKRVDGIIP